MQLILPSENASTLEQQSKPTHKIAEVVKGIFARRSKARQHAIEAGIRERLNTNEMVVSIKLDLLEPKTVIRRASETDSPSTSSAENSMNLLRPLPSNSLEQIYAQ